MPFQNLHAQIVKPDSCVIFTPPRSADPHKQRSWQDTACRTRRPQDTEQHVGWLENQQNLNTLPKHSFYFTRSRHLHPIHAEFQMAQALLRKRSQEME